MMRAWENRPDCVVSDEPFYAAWLKATGADHPMRDEVIASGETDPKKIAQSMSEGPSPDGLQDGGGVGVWYQKHMCQHWMDEVGHNWLKPLTHVFLIRDPWQVVRSYTKVRATHDVCAEDVGLPQQYALFETISAQLGHRPPVIDAQAFLAKPTEHLSALCDHLGIPSYAEEMTHWPAGPRDSDGVWARHWYESVWASTGFKKVPALEDDATGGQGLELLPVQARQVVEDCRPLYEKLRAHRLIL